VYKLILNQTESVQQQEKKNSSFMTNRSNNESENSKNSKKSKDGLPEWYIDLYQRLVQHDFTLTQMEMINILE